MRAPIDAFRHPDAAGKLRKQAIASIGALQPKIATEWLIWNTFERFDDINTDRCAHQSMISNTLAVVQSASCASKLSRPWGEYSPQSSLTARLRHFRAF
jgi:hypothetical protein